jgi:hypothetical protein
MKLVYMKQYRAGYMLMKQLTKDTVKFSYYIPTKCDKLLNEKYMRN